MLDQIMLVAGLFFFAAVPEAPPKDPPISWTVGNWYVGSVEDGCLAGVTERDTQMILSTDVHDRDQRLIFTNPGWSTVSGETYPMRLTVDSRSYKATAIGFEDGFGFPIDGDFTATLSAGNRVIIYRGDVVVEDIGLSGSANAMEKLRLCTGVLRNRIAYAKEKADAEEAERKRLARINPDPFAESSP